MTTRTHQSAASVRIQSVDRAVDLLQAVAAASAEAATVPALARVCGLNRATAWRLLKTLQARGLVAVDEATGRYSIGLATMELGNAAGPEALVAAAHPELERICHETGETAALAVAGLGGLCYVDEVTPAAVITASWVGRSVPLHATSTGKAMLAFLPDDQLHRMLGSELRSFTAATITDPEALATELAATRTRGYGICAGELEASLYGVSAPVLDEACRPLAFLSIWGPHDRVHQGVFADLGAAAVGAAARVSAARRGAGWPDASVVASAALAHPGLSTVLAAPC